MLSPLSLRTGRILISEPFLADPNFQRAVVLLADHQPDGSLGFVLNQPTDFLLKDLIPDLWDARFPVFTGGPVAVDTVHFIHSCYDKMSSGIEITKGVYWGGNFETLKLLINSNSIEPHEVKFFLGYSGWGAGQLQMEVTENTWIVSENYHVSTLFANDEQQLWRDVLINLGPKYAHVSNFPKDPSLN